MAFDRTDGLGTPEKLLVGGIGLAGLSLLFPWISASEPVLMVDGSVESEMTGLEAPDGILVFGATLVAGIVAWARRWDWITSVVVGLAGLIAAGIGFMYISDPLSGAEYSPGSGVEEAIDPGTGLYLLVLGGLLLLGASYSGYQRPIAAATDSDSGGAGGGDPSVSGDTSGSVAATDGEETEDPVPTTQATATASSGDGDRSCSEPIE